MPGDWDRLEKRFEDLDVFVAFRQVCIEAKEWKDTVFYQRFVSEVQKGHFLWRCRTLADIDRRCQRLQTLFRTIQRDGYKSQRELALSGGERATLPNDEIVVNIGRNGDLLFNDGAHRLTIAKLLRVPRVPVEIGVRHPDWTGCIVELLKTRTDLQLFQPCSNRICALQPQQVKPT